MCSVPALEMLASASHDLKLTQGHFVVMAQALAEQLVK